MILDHSNWQKHEGYRPEAVPYHDRIPDVLADPDVVVEVEYDGSPQQHFYRKGLTDGDYSHSYFHVIVHYSGDQGKIRTWWLCRTVDRKGQVTWTRPSSS